MEAGGSGEGLGVGAPAAHQPRRSQESKGELGAALLESPWLHLVRTPARAASKGQQRSQMTLKGWAGWNVGEAGMGSSLGKSRAGGTHRAVAHPGLRPLMATRDFRPTVGSLGLGVKPSDRNRRRSLLPGEVKK